jgi:hypothetical protein
MHPALPGVLCLVALTTLSRSAHAEPPAAAVGTRAVHEGARLLATAGLRGRFGDPVCREGETVKPHPRAAFTGALARAAAEPGALLIDTGGLLNPHAVARFAAASQPQTLAVLARDLGYDALTFGEEDLAAPRTRVLAVAEALEREGISYVLSNLSCRADGERLCERVRDAEDAPLILEAGSERLAFLAMLGPSALGRVAPSRAVGLSLAPLEQSLARQVVAARGAGATLVVATLDLAPGAALDLSRSLAPEARPDLLLLAGAGDTLLFGRPPSLVPALAAPPPSEGALVVRLGRSDAAPSGLDLLAAPLSVDPEATPAPAVRAFSDAIGAAYCAALGAPLAGGRLEAGRGPLDASGLTALTAAIMREAAGADVAILNREAVAADFTPSDPASLRQTDLYEALEYDEPLAVAEVPAAWLQKLLPAAARHALVTPGLHHAAADPDRPTLAELRVRGRPGLEGVTYRVVTLRFLAAGGDEALPPLPEGVRWRPWQPDAVVGTEDARQHGVRDLVVAALSRADPRDPRGVREDPADAPEWRLSGQLDGNLAGASVSNPAAYDAAQLTTRSAVALGAELRLEASATAPDWSWENAFFGNFRTQWTPADHSSEARFAEANDQLQLRSMASFRGLRGPTGGVWIPDPYLEVFTESELTRPDDRGWHWLLVRPTLGARFPLSPVLELKLQAGFQSTPLAPSDPLEPGAGAFLALKSIDLFPEATRALRLDGQVDFFWFDLFGDARWQLRGQLNLALDLGGPFALTFGTTWYAQADAHEDPGLALTATAGLRLKAMTRLLAR